MGYDRAIRKPPPPQACGNKLPPEAARHREFLEHLLSLGLTPYRISVTIDRSQTYVQKALEKTWAPNEETVDAYIEKLFLNREWLRTGKEKMVVDVRALKAFADSVAQRSARQIILDSPSQAFRVFGGLKAKAARRTKRDADILRRALSFRIRSFSSDGSRKRTTRSCVSLASCAVNLVSLLGLRIASSAEYRSAREPLLASDLKTVCFHFSLHRSLSISSFEFIIVWAWVGGHKRSPLVRGRGRGRRPIPCGPQSPA